MPGADDEALDALRFLAPRRPRRLAALLDLLRAPARTMAVLRAVATGRSLRARQTLAGLIGIDHRLALPAIVLDRFPVAPGPPADARFLVLTAPGHDLVAGAAEALDAAFADEGLHAVYGDALVQRAPGGAVVPLLRPAFDPVRLMALDVAGPVVALRRSSLAPAGIDPEAGALDALFRIAERYGRGAVGHLPRVLSLWRPWRAPGPAPASVSRQGRLAAVRGHLDRTGLSASTLAIDGEGVIAVSHALPDPDPPASLIVPTRDRLDLLRPCIESLLTRTDWPDREILICDNGSREPATLAYLRDLAARGLARIVPCPGPFDFAAMNNAAARLARGRLLVFVNNDVEAFRPDWLARLAREALRPGIGAVGAKLLDGAGRVQHGGIMLGTGGLVTHGHRHFPGDAPGYLSVLRTSQEVAAVTAACLCVEAEKFAAVGGFDGAHFAVDFNDVDLCLRLDAAGWRTLLVPGAVLHHREAASRRWTPAARERHEGEVERLRARWGARLAADPHYHPGFDPGLSTHARLRRDFPAQAWPATVR